MSNDLIRRSDAIEALSNVFADCDPCDKEEALDISITTIKELPYAQPERKKGKWILHPEQKNIYGGKCVECSECGEKYIVQYIEDEKFCRNCGADMRGDSDEDN